MLRLLYITAFQCVLHEVVPHHGCIHSGAAVTSGLLHLHVSVHGQPLVAMHAIWAFAISAFSAATPDFGPYL